jgi:hypothetical protein
MTELIFNSNINPIDGVDTYHEVPDVNAGGQVKVVFSNEVGFPSSIPGDRYPTFSEDGLALPSNLIKSVYQGTTFSIRLTFTVLDELLSAPDPENPVYIPAYNIVCTSDPEQFGIVATKTSNNSMTLSGTAVRLFEDEFYTYLLSPQETITISAINNTDVDEFYSVTRYQEPSNKEVSRTYTFNVYYTDSSNVPKVAVKNIQQFFYWNYYISMANFSSEVEKGIK